MNAFPIFLPREEAVEVGEPRECEEFSCPFVVLETAAACRDNLNAGMLGVQWEFQVCRRGERWVVIRRAR